MTEDEEMRLLTTLTNRIRSVIAGVPLSEAWRLWRLRDGLITMRDTLERIIDDDTISQTEIDDGGFAMNEQLSTNEDWRARKSRNQDLQTMLNVAGQISRLSAGRSEDETLSFLVGLEKRWNDITPAGRTRLIREYFSDPETLNIDMGPRHSMTAAWRLRSREKWERDRLSADLAIIDLIEATHRNSIALRSANVKPIQITEETIQADAINEISKLCGKPVKLVAKVSAALDWNDKQVTGSIEVDGVIVTEKAVGPRARREQLIFANLTDEPELPPRAKSRRPGRHGWTGLTELEQAYMTAQQAARERLTKAIYDAFVTLRAELARHRTEQAKNEARQDRIRRQIDQLQKQVAA